MNTRGLFVAVVWFVATVTGPAAAQQGQVSLADLARKVEAERTSSEKRPSKSYTNKDLKAPAGKPADDSAEPPAGYVSASTGEVVSAEELLKRSEAKVDQQSGATLPEEYWRQRADYLRAEFERAQNMIDKINGTPPPQALPAQARRQHEITKIRQMVDGLTRQWDKLEQSAQAAKINMAWIGSKPAFNP